ncbi:TauD/TfdA family dioxygenase [Thiohalocapsa marina]|uniref:TauD/TfdA family dioxygenase n=1 Tax=Thiohalocapsa marina TaxID=424902 RepID=A0A5M8FRA0_9GAMM|nr:TauD/TfdA family dioxygenase [Thiohalocapsa marina]KAA6185265.1 TauD/TfdA family dioxygenase [Thiohalocapsa marina]
MPSTAGQSPFSLDNHAAYEAWRAGKLAAQPDSLDDLLVEVDDPRRLTDAEFDALAERIRRANMVVYVGRTGDDPDKDIPRLLGARFGLHRLDHNPGADDDAITSITVQSDALRRGFIPYTDRPIAWHTDGYYNGADRQINAMVLHCVRPAAQGGSNGLIDHEMLYLKLRDQDPAHIRALMHPEAMTIPPNVVDGEELRPASTGPVFSLGPRGHLHMRYTDRRRNISWRDDADTTAAVGALRALLEDETLPRFEATLQPGWGLLCNNVLHRRGRFSDTDGERPRLLYRARYYDLIDPSA